MQKQTQTRAYIGLGANLGDRGTALLQALQRMTEMPHTRLVAVSSLYSSAPLDATGPDYLNAMAVIDTQLNAQACLEWLQALELAAGRERPYRNAPRTLDLDIVLWGDQTLETPSLTVPHPRMYERAFVLLPLAELNTERVTAVQLAAVQSQEIAKIDQLEWARQVAALLH